MKLENKKIYYKVSLVLLSRNLNVKTVIELGEFEKLSKVEEFRRRVSVNNPTKIVNLKIESRTDDTNYQLYKDLDVDNLDLNDILE